MSALVKSEHWPRVRLISALTPKALIAGLTMSALCGGLNGSAQDFNLGVKDGVYSERSAISSRFHSGREGGAVKIAGREGEPLKRSDGSRHLPFIAKQPCMGGDLTQVLRRPVELAVSKTDTASR